MATDFRIREHMTVERARKENAIPVNPYEFYCGDNSLEAIMSLAKTFAISFDAGAWLRPMYLRNFENLSDNELNILFEMIDEGYASNTGYGR